MSNQARAAPHVHTWGSSVVATLLLRLQPSTGPVKFMTPQAPPFPVSSSNSSRSTLSAPPPGAAARDSRRSAGNGAAGSGPGAVRASPVLMR